MLSFGLGDPQRKNQVAHRFGRDAARQLMLDASPEDPAAQVLRMLEKRPLSSAYLSKALPLGR